MKLQEHDYGFEAVLPENRTPFKIKTSAKLFDILSSGIYKDKILAVIRELSCNAYDAHVVAKKKHVPFKLRLPTRMDPTFYVEDEGTGIDPEKITDIYWTYGESSKTDSNDQIGALGLGSKSPFAYTKSSFVVKNRYQGTEYTYLCFINENGMPDGSLVSKEPTDKPSGVTVEFAVRQEDIDAFRNRTDRFFKRWAAVMPIFVDQKTTDVVTSKITKVIEGNDWYLERTDRVEYADHQGAVAMQGNVPYPIEVGSIPKMPKELAIIASNPFIITFDMGEVNFASSRESLQYDERTCSNIIERLREVRAELEKSFHEKVFKKGMTHLEFINNFRRTFREFTMTIKYNSSISGSGDVDAWYADMLLAKKKKDSVTYDGSSYYIEDLLTGVIDFNFTGHQSFGIFKAARKTTKSAKVFMKQYSLLKYVAETEIDATLIHTTWNTGSVIDEGEVLEYEWKSAAIPKRAEPTTYTRTLAIADKFSVITRNRLVIENDKVTFFVNDVGGAGEARYRAFVDRISGTSYFVNFDPKDSDVHAVVAELEGLIAGGLKGATIEMVSTQPDYRAPIEKEKIESGTMRVKFRDIIFSKRKSKTDVHGGVTVEVADTEVTINDESIVKIADLKAAPIVLYVVKRRSPTQVFDNVTTQSESIIKSDKLLILGAKYLFSDLLQEYVPNGRNKNYAQHQSLKVYIFNEGQIEWLKKRNVNVVAYRTMVADRLAKMQQDEKFLEATERAIGLKQVSMISQMFTATEGSKILRETLCEVPKTTSLFKETFVEYVNIRADTAALSDSFAKLCMYEIVNGASAHGQSISADLTARIAKKYPMLKLLNNFYYMDKKDLVEVINYIGSMDSI